MVFLQGDKLFPVGEASELLGGSLDVCGTSYCVKTLGGVTYNLPFAPGTLFSEVWTRVYDRRIDSFYLSINPTKQLLRNLSASLDRIPSGRLRFGVGTAGGGIRTHEVVTAGDIKGTQIGQILWEADVAFKSRSLRYDVLTGGRDAYFGAPLGSAREPSGEGPPPISVPHRERWCRLYWTSGAQSITVNKTDNAVAFQGQAVVARSEPMVMRSGDLVDEPRGDWCGESKSVAASLQEQANSPGGGPSVLRQLRQLAEMQNFVRWARDNGITATDAFTRSVRQHDSPPALEVPTWTSGIKTEPRVVVRQQGNLAGGSGSNYLSVSVVEDSTITNCVLPYWALRERDFPANGINRRSDGLWGIPPNMYPFVDDWMASLANKIAACSGGVAQLQPAARSRASLIRASGDGGIRIGIRFNFQSVNMHGGALLGVQQGFLEAAWKQQGLLLSVNRRPLFQSADGKLHFWNYADKHPQFGTLAQHVVIDGGEVTGARASAGRLVFTVTTGAGAVALHESRWGRAGKYAGGLEWAGSRHGGDGSQIWQQAAWPCAGREGAGCVQVSQAALEELNREVGAKRDADQIIRLDQVGENTWRVDLNISGIRFELDRRWKATPASNVNARLPLIFEYAKWGFIEDAFDRYDEVVGGIEGDTVDTVLRKLLEIYFEGN